MRYLILATLLAACSSTTTISGDAFAFNEGVDARVVGGTVRILELPGREATTDATGHFVFEGVPVGSDVTLELAHPEFTPIQTATHTVPAEGLEQLTFQAVRPAVYDLLATILAITPDPERCHMVTTATRVGRSLYDPGAHGEAGVTVTVEPPPPVESGPIYFNADVIPDRALTMTSDDGGVVFVNVPPGDYVWTAHKDGVRIREIRMRCRAGLLVNASPPWELQVY
ncbi:MAG: carboxypeptidase regulatory-like domain-containing protein [Sandaracinaceae bacterium]|nr:carboxypeptidase regulatory-like domain-containing protein [Sandaracinaceae bacterium]